jgi:hypothetical protein
VTLPEFLTACLDEDQRVTETLKEQSQTLRLALQGRGFLGKHLPGWHTPTETVEMCDRVLAGIKAKRALIERAQQAISYWAHAPGEEPIWTGEVDPDAGTWEEAVLLLAEPYKDRPGWRTEWETQP